MLDLVLTELTTAARSCLISVQFMVLAKCLNLSAGFGDPVRKMKQPKLNAIKESHFFKFRSLREKLLALMISLSLIPLVGMSGFAYFIGSSRIRDSIRLSLEKMAQDTADKIDLMLKQKEEEVHSMATTFPLIYPRFQRENRDGIIRLLNTYCFNHDVYDLLIVLDKTGNVIAVNTLDRDRGELPRPKVLEVLNSNIFAHPEEQQLFHEAMAGNSSHRDWYHSRLVQNLYDYRTEDVSYQYNVAFAEPIRNPATNDVEGVWINILNWYYFQIVLDNVEMDLANLDLRTGYAFLFRNDADTIIGHKYRANRPPERGNPSSLSNAENLYGTSLIKNHGLQNLHDAIVAQRHSLQYEFPKGNSKISGLARIEDPRFGWIIGVGVDGKDIFRPIRWMTFWLLAVTGVLALLVVVFTYWIAQGITVPLKNLIRTSQTIAHGNFQDRVQIRSADEVGILGATFNDMARALYAREEQLQELNKNLENMVRERTMELERSHEALKKAYVERQNAQEQLVQTEKMASLGQLVAGIAHEIKNPLNFIYGNTGFLADYVQKLERMLDTMEKLPSISPQDQAEIERLKEANHYAFIKEDLSTLIDNFTEGARRINTIVSDLRSFSRLDADTVSEIDLHASLEMSLNLLRNQYKDRVEIHREYGNIPKIQGYSGKLNQVFMNLLSNAFHAVQEKGEVWIRTRCDSGAVEVEVEDNGGGIPKEHLNRIFEPFFTTKPVGQGTGLGLSISYGIIEQHHGRIQVSSSPNKGSVFVVRLPIFQEKAAE
jgi:signal transduction histidine kinase